MCGGGLVKKAARAFGSRESKAATVAPSPPRPSPTPRLPSWNPGIPLIPPPRFDWQELDIDNIISRLLEVRGSRPGKTVNLTENEIRGLCTKVRPRHQPLLCQIVPRARALVNVACSGTRVEIYRIHLCPWLLLSGCHLTPLAAAPPLSSPKHSRATSSLANPSSLSSRPRSRSAVSRRLPGPVLCCPRSLRSTHAPSASWMPDRPPRALFAGLLCFLSCCPPLH